MIIIILCEYEIEGRLYFIHLLFHIMFDVVIPLGPNDTKHFLRHLEHTQKYIIGYRRIYIIAYNPASISHIMEFFPDIIVVPETAFPFSKNTVATYHGANSRNGWYYQQLLKMYAWAYLDGLLDRYLVVDADTFFVNPTRFETTDGKCIYNFAHEYNLPYFEHMARMSPLFSRTYELSGICHHMMFETCRVKEIIEHVEAEHGGKRFWETFLECVDGNLRHNIGSGASEYELYFHYMMKYHLDEIEIRELSWANVSAWTPDEWINYDYVSWHHYDQ